MVNDPSADPDQVQPVPEGSLQSLANPFTGRAGKVGIFRNERESVTPRKVQQTVVLYDIRDVQFGQTMLPRSEELARSAQLQILLGDAEPVARRSDRLKTRSRLVVLRLAEHEEP